MSHECVELALISPTRKLLQTIAEDNITRVMKLQSTGTDAKRHWLATMAALLIAGAMLAASPAEAGNADVTRAATADMGGRPSSEIARWAPLIKEASRRFG